MTDIRRIAYEALALTEDGKNRNNITKDLLAKYSYLDRQDRKFLKRLIEGTIERRITIDHVLDLYSTVPVKKMKKQVRTLLRMGTYQLLFMDGVTDHAAVNETVALSKKTGVRALSGFINAVLRSISQNKDNIKYPDRTSDPTGYMSVYYSCPEWIVDKLIKQQGEDNAQALLELSVSARAITGRVNLSKATTGSVLGLCDGTASDICDCAIVLNDPDNIADIPAIDRGLMCIQDISSMLVCIAADIKKTDTVLDLCASPGGKSMHAADLATDGTVISVDVSEAKVSKIEENAKRCCFTNVKVRVGDSTVYDPALEKIADVVIADVPCSGLGVMGRKNDIKYNVSEGSIAELVKIQQSILANAARYVKDGGTLMFSTCTCTAEENTENFKYLTDTLGLRGVDFYDRLPEKLRDDSAHEGYIQLYGRDGLTDGFFIGKLTK